MCLATRAWTHLRRPQRPRAGSLARHEPPDSRSTSSPSSIATRSRHDTASANPAGHFIFSVREMIHSLAMLVGVNSRREAVSPDIRSPPLRFTISHDMPASWLRRCERS